MTASATLPKSNCFLLERKPCVMSPIQQRPLLGSQSSSRSRDQDSWHRLKLATFNEHFKKVGRRFEFDVLDSFNQILDCLAPAPRQEDFLSPLNGSVANLLNAIFRDWSQKSNFDRITDVHIVGKTAREVKPADLSWINAELSQDDKLAAVVRRLCLSQVTGVLTRESDAVVRNNR